ncbi:ATP-binding cassette domain-containing protein [Vibrio sp. TRT 17S01]|uniref:ATP-binding cassette domain-containing protein n=1 Tax=Vibrio sp. TRT 17S01 TaxID=3418505 RepID=UPI003CF310D2
MLLNILSKDSPNKVFISLILGSISGLLYGSLIPIVMLSLPFEKHRLIDTLQDPNLQTAIGVVSNYQFAIVFVLVCLLIMFFKYLSQVLITSASIASSKSLRSLIFERLSRVDVVEFEKIDKNSLNNSLSVDIQAFLDGARFFPDLIINTITSLGVLAYIYYLNNLACLVILFIIFLGVTIYQMPILIGHRYLRKSRESFNVLMTHISDLIHGYKELKHDHKHKDEILCRDIEKAQTRMMKDETIGAKYIIGALSFGDLLSFFVIGFICYVFISSNPIPIEDLLGIFLALIFLVNPMARLLNSIPYIGKANIAIASIYESANQIKLEAIKRNQTMTENVIHILKTIELSDVGYSYEQNSSDRIFSLKDINIQLESGKINFLIGANGSGKSTLGKILSLLYRPSSGSVKLNGLLVDEENINDFRSSIRCIHFRFHIIESSCHKLIENDNPFINKMLERLELKQFISSSGELLVHSMSDGQRRRAALILMLIDDPSFMLFDEWAADQDPSFREIFYTEILPELSKRNKMILVVSHDHSYFDFADKVFVVEDGRVSERY